MRNFFIIVFGGISALLTGGLIHAVFPEARDELASLGRLPRSMLAQVSFSKTIRYTADQEEDLISNATQAFSDADKGPITASAYIVRDETTATTIASHNSTTLVPIASLTKLVTAVVARRLIAPGTHVTVSSDIIDAYGNTAQFHRDEVLRSDDLFYPLLMVSSNEAAEALAANYGRKHFIEAMNNFCQSIGAYRTYFSDASGLSPSDESTAADMAIILDWIRKNDPAVLSITTEKEKTIGSHTWVNPTHFLNWSNYIGGKNGYIPESNRTGAALFRLGVKKDVYSVVVLGSSFRDGDVIKLLAKVK